MNRHIYRLVAAVLAAITIVSCNGARKSETYRLLEDVDSYIEARPDSALAVLEGIGEEDLGSREEKAKYALLMSMALDKNYIDRTDFEVLQPAIDYYESHGSATDKLRTFYYQGRIYNNRGDSESAMKCYVYALEYGNEAEDILTKARTYYAQGYIYRNLYDYDNVIDVMLKAANIYEAVGSTSLLMNCYVRVMNSYAIKKDYDNAEKYAQACIKLLPEANEGAIGFFYSTYISYLSNTDISVEQIREIITEYHLNSTNIDYLALTNAYLNINEVDLALATIQLGNNYRSGENRLKYYALLSEIYERNGHHKEALEAYTKYVSIADSLDLIVYNQNTKFIEERHNLEVQAYQEREAKNTRTLIILICIIALLVALIVIHLIRKQLKIRTAEKRQLEIEKKRYEQLYADAIAERDALTKMIEDSSVKDETKVVIRERLEVLNKVIISHITDTSSANKKAFQELEALVADRDSFIESTRLTIEGNNPEFITALKKQGLTDEEINICCLYAIGLKGKDIKAYTSQPRHYNQSADIRHKLGLTENDTNLSIFLREMLEK